MSTKISIREQASEQRLRFYEVMQTLLLSGELSMGQALRLLRGRHLGMTRRQFATKVGLSNTALTDLETDSGNPTLSSIEAAFRPFGFRVGLVPVTGAAVRLSPPAVEPQELLELSAAILRAVNKRPRRSTAK